MANTVIVIRNSSTPSNTPSGLANGELALNFADEKLYFKNSAGVVKYFYTSSTPTGLNKEIQFNDSGVLGSNSNLTFDKITGNFSAGYVSTRTFIEFADGSRQYTANAGSGGSSVTSVAGATGAVSNTNILDGLKTVDGSGSGLDADLLDGLNSTSFANATFTQAAFDKANTDVTSLSVSSGTYGSATIVPVFTLLANGRVSTVTNTSISFPVTSVGSFTGAVSNTNLLDGLKSVDGSGSGLDADFLDGLDSSSFANATFTQAAFDKANTDVTSISTTAGTFGSSTVIPVIVVASNGRISSISNTSIASYVAASGGTLTNGILSGNTSLPSGIITSGGSIGVGTINPSSLLTVAGTIESTTGGFKFPDGTTQTTASTGGGGGGGISLAAVRKSVTLRA